MGRAEIKILGWFTLAGLLLPIGVLPLWWLVTKDGPILTFSWFNRLADVLWPGRHWIPAYSGPWYWNVVIRRLAIAEVMNVLIYAVIGILVAVGFKRARLARKPRSN
jgi:hypothetical protein